MSGLKPKRNFGNIKSFHSFAAPMANPEIIDRIRSAAHGLFMRYGVRAVSMDDIAESLGISKKTIYQYFKDKDELVLTVTRDNCLENQAVFLSSIRLATNAVQEILMAMERSEALLSNMNPSLIFELKKYHPGAFAEFFAFKNEFLADLVLQNLKRGIREEYYRPELDISIVSRFRVETMMLPFDPTFMAGLKANLVQTKMEILQLYLYGIVTPKGYKLLEKQLKKKKRN
jgi:AcrR family transcriptional regulator